MKVGQELFSPGTTLPVIPPIEEDELISSWLHRTARLYGQSIMELLGADCQKRLDLPATDLGTARSALRAIANLLGVSIDAVAAHTIGAAYPWAVNLVARELRSLPSWRPARLRYAACPYCLEQQRLMRGVSWLRRSWVLAPRTVCSLHHVPLEEEDIGSCAHPVWSDFLKRHGQRDLSLCGLRRGVGMSVVEATPARTDGPYLHRRMAAAQDGILADAARTRRGRRVNGKSRAGMITDIIWALTRQHRCRSDRLVYEFFASNVLDNPWHMAQRRQPGPATFPTLRIRERHILFATATLLLEPAEYQRAFYEPSLGVPDITMLPRFLSDTDLIEWQERQYQWPERFSA
jgi:hypothetical protein